MKTVIEMAREADFCVNEDGGISTSNSYGIIQGELERFAELVRAEAIADERSEMMGRIRDIIVQAEERGAAAEREACAKLADKVEYRGACESDVARAIRAMGGRAVGNRAYDRYEGDNT